MATLKKTIQINPELFKLPNNKTRKTKEKKITPIINPNTLKNKLLNRIKQHKQQEIKEQPKHNHNATNHNATNHNDNFDSNDEFNSAVNYLSHLSKKQKQHNKTIKSNTYISSIPHVELELPDELQDFVEPKPQVNTPPMNIHYKTDNVIPYGCLKGGAKPTYKTWTQTQKQRNLTHYQDYDYQDYDNQDYDNQDYRPPTPPKRISDDRPSNFTVEPRENKLEQIKQKIRKIQENEIKNKTLENYTNINNNSNTNLDAFHIFDKPVVNNNNNNNNNNNSKKYLKKTIKRKYTLGKHPKIRKVGILLKDKHTRKNILNAQKELKRVSIQDVRKYLRQKGIIKVGTTAPVDVLRKMFESAMLTGDVTNTNKYTLLHNFLNEDKE
jgi:hypothetical protein